MHTPITVFEAWLGRSIAAHLCLDYDKKLMDINYLFAHLSVETEDNGEFAVHNDTVVLSLKKDINKAMNDVTQELEAEYQYRIDNYDTYEQTFEEVFNNGSKHKEIGLALCEYHDTQQDLNDNHFQMAKNDKANFETLILNINK